MNLENKEFYGRLNNNENILMNINEHNNSLNALQNFNEQYKISKCNE